MQSAGEDQKPLRPLHARSSESSEPPMLGSPDGIGRQPSDSSKRKMEVEEHSPEDRNNDRGQRKHKFTRSRTACYQVCIPRCFRAHKQGPWCLRAIQHNSIVLWANVDPSAARGNQSAGQDHPKLVRTASTLDLSALGLSKTDAAPKPGWRGKRGLVPLWGWKAGRTVMGLGSMRF